MAANLRTNPVPQASKPQESPAVEALALPAQAYLARLAALHDEAAETAHLANLLGRAPWVAGALAAATISAAFYFASGAATAALIAWCVLTAAAVAAIARVYDQAIKAPFDRATLKDFTRNMTAVLLYAGAAWASGLVLVLPWDAGVAVSVAFVSVLPAVVAAIIRARDVSFCFLGSATVMGAFCALMRGADLRAMLGILAAGAAIAIVAGFSDRLRAPELRVQPG